MKYQQWGGSLMMEHSGLKLPLKSQVVANLIWISIKGFVFIAAFPASVILSSEGSIAEKYPDSLGEYQLLPNIGQPVYKSLITANSYIRHSGH